MVCVVFSVEKIKGTWGKKKKRHGFSRGRICHGRRGNMEEKGAKSARIHEEKVRRKQK